MFVTNEKRSMGFTGGLWDVFLVGLSLPNDIMMILIIIGSLSAMLFLYAAGPYLVLYHVVGLSKGISMAIEAAWLIVFVISLCLIIYGIVDLVDKRKVRKAQERHDREIAIDEYERTRNRIERAKEYDDRRIPLEMGVDP